MSTKNYVVLAFLVLLASFSLYLNRDRFGSAALQVSHRSVSPRNGQTRSAGAQIPADPVVFLLSRPAKLTSVKVVVADDAATNKFPHAIWSLVSDSSSASIKEFTYGSHIRGMKLEVKGVDADPLDPGVKYRLLLQTQSDKLEYDFIPVPLAK